MATVLPAGHMQFNDEPGDDGVSATKKNAVLKNSAPTLFAQRPKGLTVCLLLGPKAIAFFSTGA